MKPWGRLTSVVLMASLCVTMAVALTAQEVGGEALTTGQELFPPAVELPEKVQVLSPIEAYGFIRLNPDVNLVDVRENWELEGRGVIEGASVLGYLQPTFREHFKMVVLREKEPILIYCALGTRAKLAAKIAVELGYKDVQIIEGGLRAWQKAGLPVKL